MFGTQDDDKEGGFIDEVHQMIYQLKQRKISDTINMILSAAALGNVDSLKLMLKVKCSLLADCDNYQTYTRY